MQESLSLIHIEMCIRESRLSVPYGCISIIPEFGKIDKREMLDLRKIATTDKKVAPER